MTGIKLLEPLVEGKRPRVLVFDFSNPFTFSMQLDPPRGTLMWWHVGATFSSQTAPRGADVFREVDVVMIPKCPEDTPTVSTMLALYPRELALFDKRAETEDWIMLARREPL
jgi:hypothetical protein